MSEKKQSKSTQERHERLLNELLKVPGNEYCADCRAKNPRWASFSLGVFLCVRCASIHRKMGTHISRIKSLTMDQWSMEQIESLKNAGGNIKVNNIVNPNPSKYPLPLADDEGPAMERYVRNKWEKRAFMESPARSSTMNTTTIGLQQKPRNVPMRSSSVPLLNSDKLNSDLLHLNQMGFKDNVKNQAALHQANGNLNNAIDILTRNISNNSNNNNNSGNMMQQRDTQDSLTMEQKLVQLRNMGYTNIEHNRDILRRTGGNVDVAVTLLKSNSTTTTSSLSQPITPFNPNSNNDLFSNTTSIQQQSPIFKNGKIISSNNNSNNNNNIGNNQIGQLLDTNTQNLTTNHMFSLQQIQPQQLQQQQLQLQQQQLLHQQQQQQLQLLQQQQLQQHQLQQQSFPLQPVTPDNANPLAASTPLNPFGQNIMSIPSPSANSIQTPQSNYFTMMQNGGTVLNGIPNQMTGIPIQQQQQINTPTNNPFSSFSQPPSIPQQQIFTPSASSSPFTNNNNMIQQVSQQQQFPNFTQQQQITRSSFF